MTVVVSLLLSVVLVKQFLLPPRVRQASTVQAAAGTDLKRSLPDVDWAKNGRTLVLAISTRCHFCTESAPFFRRIAKERASGVKLLAVLPQPVEEARQYLEGEGVHVDDVRQASSQSIGVSGTPTLLLVDARGTVSDVWRGKLHPNDEEKVIAALRGERVR
jgi:peroxiredoxin